MNFYFYLTVYLYLHHILNLTLTPTLDIKRLFMIGSCLPYVFVFFRNRKKGSSSLFGLILFAKKENSRGTLEVLDRGSTVYEQYYKHCYLKHEKPPAHAESTENFLT
jgi:hypothetical protein